MPTGRRLTADLEAELASLGRGGGLLLALTGAGISAESGIPTFRGQQGYWTIGSTEYRPEHLATYAAFSRMPEAVWVWYLYRRAVCRAATPSTGHRVLAELADRLGDDFLLITQNVDGLHLRAGSPVSQTYQIHGNLDYARCDAGCGQPMWALDIPGVSPDTLRDKQQVPQALRSVLCCPSCGGPSRPHVLWFDECYDDAHFHFSDSLRAARSARVLLSIGTSGATSLPLQIASLARASGATVVDINPEMNPFSELASRPGCVLRGSAGDYLPQVCRALCGR